MRYFSVVQVFIDFWNCQTFILFLALPMIFARPFMTFCICYIVPIDWSLLLGEGVLENGVLELGVQVFVPGDESLVFQNVLGQGFLRCLDYGNRYVGLFFIDGFLEISVQFLVCGFELVYFALELSSHFGDFLTVFLDLFCVTTIVPLSVFSGSTCFGGYDPIYLPINQTML